jgi:hypothetical protein
MQYIGDANTLAIFAYMKSKPIWEREQEATIIFFIRKYSQKFKDSIVSCIDSEKPKSAFFFRAW